MSSSPMYGNQLLVGTGRCDF